MRCSRLPVYPCLLPFMALLILGSIGCGSGTTVTLPAAVLSPTANPLVAEYAVTVRPANATAWVEFGTDTHYGRQTSQSLPTSKILQTLTVQVAGMKANTTYHIRGHVESAEGSWVDQDRTFTTGSIKGLQGEKLGLPTIKVTQPNTGHTLAPGVELFSSIQPGTCNINTGACTPTLVMTFATDLQGNIIWYYDQGSSFPFPIKALDNGHFIMNLGPAIREIDLAGNTIRELTIDEANQSLKNNGSSLTLGIFHHDMLVLPNGHWVVLSATSKDFTDLPGYPGTTSVNGDVVVDFDPMGNVVWTWSAFDHLDVNRHLNGLPDWTHGNALVYLPDGNLLLSMRHQSWILKLDYQNGAGAGDVLWKLGAQGDFTLTGGDQSQWFFAEHNPNLLSSNGSQMTLAIMDNGDARLNPDGSVSNCGWVTIPGSPCYTRGTIFQADEATKVATLQFEFFPGIFSFWGGTANQLSNGDMEFEFSASAGLVSASRIVEVTHTVNPELLWQLDVTGENAYRAYRIPSLYPGVTWKQ